LLQEPLSHIAPTEPSALQASLARFSSWLSSPAVLHSTRLAALSGHGVPDRVHRSALGRLARAYAQLCAAVKDPKNRYEAATTLLGGERPFGQVNLLWQIFGIEEDETE
jgi:conserved oligomeric Golgi complex subunit 6